MVTQGDGKFHTRDAPSELGGCEVLGLPEAESSAGDWFDFGAVAWGCGGVCG